MQDESYPALKRCCACHESKAFASFYHDASRADGLRAQCIDCNRRWRSESVESRKASYARYYSANAVRIAESRRFERQANPEHRAEIARRYRAKSRSKIAAAERRWRDANPDRRNEAERAWRAANPEKARAKHHANNHRRRVAEGAFTAAEWLALCSKYDARCLACDAADRPLTPDHIVPVSRGGSSWISNIQPLCMPCNQAKGTQTIDYRPSQ